MNEREEQIKSYRENRDRYFKELELESAIGNDFKYSSDNQYITRGEANRLIEKAKQEVVLEVFEQLKKLFQVG